MHKKEKKTLSGQCNPVSKQYVVNGGRWKAGFAPKNPTQKKPKNLNMKKPT